MIGDDMYNSDKQQIDEAVEDILDTIGRWSAVGVHPIRLCRAVAKACKEDAVKWKAILEEDDE